MLSSKPGFVTQKGSTDAHVLVAVDVQLLAELGAVGVSVEPNLQRTRNIQAAQPAVIVVKIFDAKERRKRL
jgi:hypothetical protein